MAVTTEGAVTVIEKLQCWMPGTAACALADRLEQPMMHERCHWVCFSTSHRRWQLEGRGKRTTSELGERCWAKGQGARGHTPCDDLAASGNRLLIGRSPPPSRSSHPCRGLAGSGKRCRGGLGILRRPCEEDRKSMRDVADRECMSQDRKAASHRVAGRCRSAAPTPDYFRGAIGPCFHLCAQVLPTTVSHPAYISVTTTSTDVFQCNSFSFRFNGVPFDPRQLTITVHGEPNGSDRKRDPETWKGSSLSLPFFPSPGCAPRGGLAVWVRFLAAADGPSSALIPHVSAAKREDTAATPKAESRRSSDAALFRAGTDPFRDCHPFGEDSDGLDVTFTTHGTRRENFSCALMPSSRNEINLIGFPEASAYSGSTPRSAFLPVPPPAATPIDDSKRISDPSARLLPSMQHHRCWEAM
ncbi:hypothetical protein P280DRAFT_534152 [Massarina eburnea CBS 473.64]|uniref:Uncharacterized protein n=1 Tax=Massarina eburnea CBS 473.64 TaxID=1395130 RepID=A0A6A6RPT9_9PLEO|nr:hypothetical protein P280DRAFT_534152 [Massarina eburnea CBS 473.64]